MGRKVEAILEAAVGNSPQEQKESQEKALEPPLWRLQQGMVV